MPADTPRLRSAMKRLRASSADARNSTASEDSPSASRAPAKRARRERSPPATSGDVDLSEVAGPAFLDSVKVGPPKKSRKLPKAPPPPPSSSPEPQRLNHRRPPPLDDDGDSSSTRSQRQRSFVPMDPSARSERVEEPALDRKYASTATQTERYTCDACADPAPEAEAPARPRSSRTRSSEATDFVPNGLLSMPPQGPASPPEPEPEPPHTRPRTQTAISAFSSTVIGTASDGTPHRQFHIASGSSSRPRSRRPSRSPSKAPTYQPPRSSPLKPRADSEYHVTNALSQVRDFSTTPDLEEPDMILEEKDDDDPIENESPARVDAPPVASSSKLSFPMPAPRSLPSQKFKAPRLSAKERHLLAPGLNRSVSRG